MIIDSYPHRHGWLSQIIRLSVHLRMITEFMEVDKTNRQRSVRQSLLNHFSPIQFLSNIRTHLHAAKNLIKFYHLFIIACQQPPSTMLNAKVASSRRPLLNREPPIGIDRDENKYKRRTPAEIFSRWSR